MFKSQLLFISIFIICIFIDHIIKHYSFIGSIKIKYYYMKFINLNYFYMLSLLFLFFLVMFYFLSWLLPSLFPISLFKNIFFNIDDLNMSDSINNTGSTNTTNNKSLIGNININTPHISMPIPVSSLNNIAAALSASGGAVAAAKVAPKYQVLLL